MSAARRCGVCGAPAPPPFRAPAPEMAPDLDLRPGEPTRSTLPEWVRHCAACGAAALDLATLSPSLRAVIDGPAYRALEAPAYAVRFRRWAMICEAQGERDAAAEAVLQAAWSADDAADSPNAARWRAAASVLWGEPKRLETALRRLDVLRRAAEFQAADAAAGRLDAQALDDTSARVLAFQRGRIAEHDPGRHLISSALPPPAHRRSATPARPPKRGLLQRWLG